MKLPESMWGAHGAIPVVPKDDLRDDDDGAPLNGCYIPDERVIYISPKCKGRLLEETLNHEWLHAVIIDAGGDQIMNDDLHEWICRVVSKALVSRRRGTR